MAGIFDEVMGAVGTVSTLATQAADPNTTTPPVEDRLTALEGFVTQWGPLIEKIAPLIEKL